MSEHPEPVDQGQLYGNNLEPAEFAGLKTTQPEKILQMREDPEVTVRAERPYYFRDEQERVAEEKRISESYAIFIDSLRHLHNQYDISFPGIAVAFEPIGDHEGRTYVAANKVYGTYFAYEHTAGKGHPEYQLEKIPEEVTTSAFDHILHYYEDVVDDKLPTYIADIRLGNIMFGRLQGDQEDHFYLYDLEEYYSCQVAQSGYSPVINTIRTLRAQSSLENDLFAMQHLYHKEFEEFSERLTQLREKAHVKHEAGAWRQPLTKETEPADSYSTRPAQAEDAQALRPVLEQWVKDSETGALLTEEIDDILSQIEESAQGETGRHYVVAQASDGQVVGVMGLTDPSDDMKEYAKTEHPLEIVNAFVAGDQRGKGVGKTLLAALEQEAIKQGGTELVVNSGPRYQESGWGFYNSLFGSPATVLKDKYGPGRDAPVWRKEIA